MNLSKEMRQFLLFVMAAVIATVLVMLQDTDPFGTYLVAIIFFLWLKDNV